ncbi:hypothetical protein [Branchiibius hedensis]|uniref:hypothetical protein n=1 Tax=Branchiibius hedensis TaxID=672460 RepID=UPI0011B281E8|nr:hypothetical protein [Branchiibius hedensis]
MKGLPIDERDTYLSIREGDQFEAGVNSRGQLVIRVLSTNEEHQALRMDSAGEWSVIPSWIAFDADHANTGTLIDGLIEALTQARNS